MMILASPPMYTLAQTADAPTLSAFMMLAVALAVVMLIWDTVEVGRNDAANIVNAVFGSRILSRRAAVRVAAVGVILGASMSSDVIETAQKGIFDPHTFTFEEALAIFTSVYIVDTVLLYSYSAFGMPVSTTAALVFELVGASLFLGIMRSPESFRAVEWAGVGRVMLTIVCSIGLSGFMGFFLQRIIRAAIGDKWSSLPALLLHGGWAGGGLMAGLAYFMLVKGMKNLELVRPVTRAVRDNPFYGPMVAVTVLWIFFAMLIHLSLIIFRKRAAELLFPALTILGMFGMAFAFGQNDLANCAAPGLAVIKLVQLHAANASMADFVRAEIPRWALFGCGVLLVAGMMTEYAQRVTRAEVRTGSAGHHVKLWAPKWCIALAVRVLERRRREQVMPSLAPIVTKNIRGKTMHYDPLRACVIMCVSASVIATASAMGMPVSTTYVAFACVVATGIADRIFVRGDAALKLGRAIWVVSSWVLSGLIAMVATGLVCLAVFYLGIFGMAGTLVTNLFVRAVVKRRSDAQEERIRLEARERMHPEEFSLEEE
ncbi:MAG: inorganic phosphate transporter [Planctomycetota bacterium]|nr:MAG: inorganic phosphate transporter [Planctomycetota bacterium]